MYQCHVYFISFMSKSSTLRLYTGRVGVGNKASLPVEVLVVGLFSAAVDVDGLGSCSV